MRNRVSPAHPPLTIESDVGIACQPIGQTGLRGCLDGEIIGAVGTGRRLDRQHDRQQPGRSQQQLGGRVDPQQGCEPPPSRATMHRVDSETVPSDAEAGYRANPARSEWLWSRASGTKEGKVSSGEIRPLAASVFTASERRAGPVLESGG